MGSISSNVQNDRGRDLKRFAQGYFCELSPEISCVLYIGLLWDIIHSGLKLCA